MRGRNLDALRNLLLGDEMHEPVQRVTHRTIDTIVMR